MLEPQTTKTKESLKLLFFRAPKGILRAIPFKSKQLSRERNTQAKEIRRPNLQGLVPQPNKRRAGFCKTVKKNIVEGERNGETKFFVPYNSKQIVGLLSYVSIAVHR